MSQAPGVRVAERVYARYRPALLDGLARYFTNDEVAHVERALVWRRLRGQLSPATERALRRRIEALQRKRRAGDGDEPRDSDGAGPA